MKNALRLLALGSLVSGLPLASAQGNVLHQLNDIGSSAVVAHEARALDRAFGTSGERPDAAEGLVDLTPPRAEFSLFRDGEGIGFEIRIFDLESGIERIEFLRVRNVIPRLIDVPGTFEEGSVAVFPADLPTEVTIRITKNDLARRSTFVVEATNGAGRKGKYDPVLTTLTADTPVAFELEQNYPNPFNPETRIRYHLTEAGPVALEVFDLAGRKVATLVEGVVQPGVYEAEWDGTSDTGQVLAGGAYLYRLRAGASTRIRTMMLLK